MSSKKEFQYQNAIKSDFPIALQYFLFPNRLSELQKKY
jgi:hypothetical protein